LTRLIAIVVVEVDCTENEQQIEFSWVV